MDEYDWLAERFEENRPHLRAVAYRVLGSASEADDAVRDAWLRFSRSGADEVENLGGWLTTIVARISLNMLQSRRSRREEPMGPPAIDAADADGTNPEHKAVLADSVGLALLVVLDTLTPAERLAFVLHDMFAVPFDEIAPIVERSALAAAATFSGRAAGARLALIDGLPGMMWAQGGQIRAAFDFTIAGGKIVAIELIGDPEHLARLEIVPLRRGSAGGQRRHGVSSYDIGVEAGA